jgi:ABC-2 type transport system permease protein
MKALMVSEWRKLRTTKTAWLLGAATLAIAVITAFAASSGEFAAERPLFNPILRDMPVFVGLFVLVLGLRSVTDEFRYGTITATVLASPDRGRVVMAKAIVSGAVGMAYAVIAEAVAIGLAVILAASKGPVTVEGSFLTQLLVGAAVAGGLTAVLGVGVGAVVKHQLAAVVGGVAWFLIAEDLLAGILKDAGTWLPARSSHGLSQVAKDGLLRWETAAAVFAVYAVFAVGAGALAMRRRDV